MMMQELDKEEGDRINMSISRKAYDALATYTRQVNEKNNDIQKKPFTIEEVLDEEIIFLFSDEWKKDQQQCNANCKVTIRNLYQRGLHIMKSRHHNYL